MIQNHQAKYRTNFILMILNPQIIIKTEVIILVMIKMQQLILTKKRIPHLRYHQ